MNMHGQKNIKFCFVLCAVRKYLVRHGNKYEAMLGKKKILHTYLKFHKTYCCSDSDSVRDSGLLMTSQIMFLYYVLCSKRNCVNVEVACNFIPQASVKSGILFFCLSSVVIF
jgi:hypothetical protein